ncbi:hypothetical protein BDP27DRAFT_1446096 [Rhodocollybia butyracea]|uniref:Uncharacterized protein n=1 Tax=Rhodocollybia butyracea TaxID=206335 RepID=A0A9P5PZF6_9AGAR|nr:hypothetical protein BDP27DRAFT_1446096 [Rhodocollybia butyracea]
MLMLVISRASTAANSTIKSDYTLHSLSASSALNIASPPTEVDDMSVALSAVLTGAIVVGVLVVLILVLVSIILYRRYRLRLKRRLFVSSPSRFKDRVAQIDPFLLLPTRHPVSKKIKEEISRTPPNTLPGRSAQHEDAIEITCPAGHRFESLQRSKGQPISVRERTAEGVSRASTKLNSRKFFPFCPRREDTVKELRRTIEELKRQQRELRLGLFPPVYSENPGPPITV